MKIKTIKKINNNSDKYDIMTSNHNYYANNILIHNCTLVLTYDNQQLSLAAARGDGKVGQDVTEIIKTQNAIPKYIADKGHVVVRGEFLITFNEFKKINANLQNGEQPYKNSRNLSSGLLHQQDLKIAKSRQGIFNVFELVKCTGFENLKTYEDHLKWCLKQGFNIVQYIKVNKSTVKAEIDNFEKKIIPGVDHPVDGLVCRYNDNKLVALGYSSHAPKFSIAYKFVDETAPTNLKTIQWSASRTGRINPVAIFDPVELEGTTVQKCTLNNLSFIKEKLGNPYIGQEIYIKKNNMIIPGIDENYTKPNKTVNTNLIPLPKVCPSCGGPIKITNDHGTEFIYCENPNCVAKSSKKLELFASKSAMNFDGISSATINAFVDTGLLKNFSDFYDLPNHKDELFQIEGFGQKSYDNLVKVLDASKSIEAWKLLFALGIPNIGIQTAQDICNHFNNQFLLIIRASAQDFMQISGIGSTVATSMEKWFRNQNNLADLNKLLNIITFKQPVKPTVVGSKLAGKSFAATGKLDNFTRKSIEESVLANGGTWIGAVNKNLQYLICNEDRGSSKSQKAKELGVQVITEQEYLGMIN